MSLDDRFSPQARRTLVHAGLGALRAGHVRLDTDFLLLGLTEVTGAAPPLERRGVDSATIRAEIERRTGAGRRPGDRELLATLGIDLDEVRRRAYGATTVPHDDPELWRLRRAAVRPLRVSLVGPCGRLRLTGRGRKVVEVTSWAAGRGAPVGGEHLLWGLLADGSNESVRILRRLGVDLAGVWADIHRRTAA